MIFRPQCDDTMKVKQLSNIALSATSVSSSLKRQLKGLIWMPPDFSTEIAQAWFLTLSVTKSKALNMQKMKINRYLCKLSREIMTLFTGQMDTASTRMNFLINPSLKQQLSYLKVQVKFDHMSKLNQKFDGIKDDMIEDIQEQIEVFGSVYQLMVHK